MSSSPMPSSPLMHAPTPLGNKRSLWQGSAASSATKPIVKKRKLVASSSSSDAPDAIDAVLFKRPLLPARLKSQAMTPRTPSSSSTAGTERMSSSPFPDLPSSPTRHSKSSALILVSAPISLDMPRDTALLFGRSRHFHTSQVLDPVSSTGSPPPLLASKLETPNLATKCISLPRSATHASRIHAALEYSPQRDVLRVIVMGQNGCKLSGDLRFVASSFEEKKSRKSKRVRAGDVIELERPAGARGVSRLEIDFYGSKVMVSWPAGSVPKQQPASVQIAPLTVPSSPISDLSEMSSESEGEEEEEAEEEEEDADVASELSPMPSSPAPLQHSSPPPQISEKITIDAKPLTIIEKAELIEEILAHEETTPLVPSDVDIPALLASTVVFSGSSAISLPDLVKALLETQPALRAHATEQIWRTWSADVLESDTMFGKVQRNGKDSSGHPLLPLFYYIPANDPDLARAGELGSLVRPLRSVQRAGGKAIDWRPVGSGRRRYY